MENICLQGLLTKNFNRLKIDINVDTDQIYSDSNAMTKVVQLFSNNP